MGAGPRIEDHGVWEDLRAIDTLPAEHHKRSKINLTAGRQADLSRKTTCVRTLEQDPARLSFHSVNTCFSQALPVYTVAM